METTYVEAKHLEMSSATAMQKPELSRKLRGVSM